MVLPIGHLLNYVQRQASYQIKAPQIQGLFMCFNLDDSCAHWTPIDLCST